MPTVFMSSTFVDLAGIRQNVIHWLSEVFGVELAVMETFGSDATPPDITSVRRVRDCDLFIGIYARRYGTVDPISDGADIPRSSRFELTGDAALVLSSAKRGKLSRIGKGRDFNNLNPLFQRSETELGTILIPVLINAMRSARSTVHHRGVRW